MSLDIVFFGTPEFALPTLEALLVSRHRVVGVVTQPDRPKGRGQRVTASPVKARAQSSGCLLLQPTSLKDPEFLETLHSLAPDVGVVAAYGRILAQSLIDVPRLGMLNVHASLLPRHRGAAPVHRAIISGDSETGVTIMRLVQALDAGPMLAVKRRAIGPYETAVEVERDLAAQGAHLLVSTLDRLSTGTVEEEPQDEHAATYAPRLTKGEGLIDWSLPAAVIHNRVRGLHPWPHAFTFLDDRRLIVRRSRPSPSAPRSDAGTVVRADPDDLAVATGLGTLHVDELQTEGGRPLAIREFLAGHRIEPGAVFRNPP